ncbi:M23 family metallopeptidase [Patescibacteria group bacterium]|nr:M23 family metallopeptidase [Patescibacteria group bacterium]MBU4466571.1 M23 family metallopeptidase [Patescibacteria group bacterium]
MKLTKLTGSRQDPLFYCGCFAFALLLITPILGVPVSNNIFSTGLSEEASKGNSNSHLALGPFTGVFQSPDFYLIQRNSFKAMPPSGTIKPQVLATLSENEEDLTGDRSGIVEYIVKAGDTLSSIADQFGLSLETILWANNLTKNSTVTIGKKLVILPTSGTMHMVKAGETLGEIVKKYKGDLTQTISFNDLDNENQVFIGDIVVIPGGILPPKPVVAVKPTPGLAPTTAGYFLCPVSSPCRITQGLHWYNAIDFSHGKCGEPIYAAASGIVQRAKTTTLTSRWAFGGAGNHISISHPNNTTTFYGHLLSVVVNVGDQVSKGQVIAYMGGAPGTPGAGRSTGCHLHFGITGASNPFAR